MGASFITMSVPVDLTDAEIKRQFEEAQASDRYENGHSYSGGIGMATGLRLLKGRPTFPSYHDAEEFLSETCVKWDQALAVKHKTTEGREMWLIGAMCAS